MKSPRFFSLACFGVGVLFFLSVQAMQLDRPFPEGIKRGKLSTTPLAELVIDGKLRSGAAGIRIYSDENLTVTQASLDVRNVVIFYLENESGEIAKLWILTAEEASQPFPRR